MRVIGLRIGCQRGNATVTKLTKIHPTVHGRYRHRMVNSRPLIMNAKAIA